MELVLRASQAIVPQDGALKESVKVWDLKGYYLSPANILEPDSYQALL